jgi:hypothetical protein
MNIVNISLIGANNISYFEIEEVLNPACADTIHPGQYCTIVKDLVFIDGTGIVTAKNNVKIKMITEEEMEMGRKVGNYINPATGEADWFEPDTIGMVILQPKMATKVGDTTQTAIDFKLDNIDAERVVTIAAQYTNNGKVYSSDLIKIEEEEFGLAFSQKIYSNKSLDEVETVKQAKDRAVQNLTNKLLEAGIMMGGMQFTGFGFITVDGDKVLTIESIEFTYRVESGRPVRNVTLKHCVGHAQLSNLKNPQITFYTGKHKVAVTGIEVLESIEGRVKDYVLKVEDLTLVTDDTFPKHDSYTEYRFSNEDFLDTFVNERRTHLDDVVNSDNDLSDRFGGFNF